MNSIKDCFVTILQGDKEESRTASRRVSKVLYGKHDRSIYDDIKQQVSHAERDYKTIVEPWRQEYFVVALSVIYYLHDREAQPDFLFPWFYELLQHDNGVIRYAAVRMISNEFGPLTVSIRFPHRKSNYYGTLTKEQTDGILYALFIRLNQLLSTLWKPAYKRYKYVDSLPTGPYKSVQMVIAHLTELCGEEYMDQLSARYHSLN